MKIERKVYAFIISMILLGVVIGSIYADRTITDMNDDIYTKIRCSNGNVYAFSQVNLQTAITEVGAAGGGSVLLPAGTIYVTSPILLANKTMVLGSGSGTVLKIGSGYVDASGFYSIFKAASDSLIHNATIADMTLHGNNTRSGINVHTVSDCVFRNLKIYDVTSYGLNLRENCTRLIVDNVHIFDVANQHGIAMQNTHDSVITNIIIKGSTGYAIDFACGGTNLIFSNILIEDCNAGFEGNGEEVAQYNITIDNVIIRDGGTGDMFRFYKVHNLNINNVVLDTCAADGNGFILGSTGNGCSHVNVNNMVVRNLPGTNGIAMTVTGASFASFNNIMLENVYVGMRASYSDNITFSNVRIKDSAAYNRIKDCRDFALVNCEFISNGNTGLIVKTCQGFVISNSIFSRNALMGLWVDDGHNFRVSNCIFELNIGDGLDTAAGGGAHNFSIMNNMFKSNAKGVDLKATDDYYFVTHNHFIGDTLTATPASKGLVEKNIGDDI